MIDWPYKSLRPARLYNTHDAIIQEDIHDETLLQERRASCFPSYMQGNFYKLDR